MPLTPVPGTRPLKNRFPLAFAALAAVVAVTIVEVTLNSRHDGVTTAVGEQRLLTLEDGTRVFMNTSTRVVVNYDKDVRRIELLTGEALFDVAKKADRPFIVTAGDRQVRALGTSFVVRRDEQRVAVILVEGKVSVSSITPAPAKGQARGGAPSTITLTPGERVTFTEERRQLNPEMDRPSLNKATAWRRGQVVLDDTPLSAAAAEMNRYNPVKLVIEHPEAEGLLVNGLFQAGDSLSFANAVAQHYGLQVTERDDEILLSGMPGSSQP